jgi:RimJ/RimL family protein N-acetyltransferase
LNYCITFVFKADKVLFKIIGGIVMFIKQDDLTIRNATIDDAPILGKWWRDGAVMAHAGFPKGLHVTDNEIATQLSADTDETRRRLIIEYCNIPIGEMGYYNKGDGVAEIGIKICDFEKQEKGYGTQLLNMLICTLFNKYGYSKIILDTNLNNKRAQHVYEKLGFRKVRVNMNSWKNQLGELQSSVDYEMTKNNFENHIKYAKITIV